MKRIDGGQNLKSFNYVYDERKVIYARYMAISQHELIATAWNNEIWKEQTSFKKETEERMKRVGQELKLK